MVTYLNTKTCQVTADRAVFRKWLRAGYEVEVWRGDKRVMVFRDLGLYL